MRILFLGDDNPAFTSAHRAATLRRLGHDVSLLNPRAGLPKGRLVGGVSTRLGLWPFLPWVNSRLRRSIGSARFDLAWVDCGSELSPSFHRWLRRRVERIVNYNCDDPFGGRDGHKWDLYLRSLGQHDLTVVMRRLNMREAQAAGARKIARVLMSYDPIAHAPLDLSAADRVKWGSEVVFVGSWMPERGPFMVRLLELGVPLTIRGNRWEKAPEFERLRAAILGPAVLGPEYVKAIQGAKVALGLLSKGNRDLHTQRSAETPFIAGAAFCAERTEDHERMFRHGVEAMLWDDAAGCAAACRTLLADEPARLRMVAAARARIVQLGLSNDVTLEWILSALNRPDPILERPLPEIS